MTADLAMMPAHELVKLFKARKASPVEATKAALARVDAFNGQLNAFQHLDPDSAMRQARASEKRWKKGGKRLSDIDGVPITIKDMVLTKGMPTRMGSLATDPDGPFTVDAPVAQRLREAGTVLLGKTTSPEYGWKGVTDSKLFGATHNPWKIGRTSGGSSGGGTAAEAVGMATSPSAPTARAPSASPAPSVACLASSPRRRACRCSRSRRRARSRISGR